MTFHEQLARVTAADREFLLSAPVIRRALAGDVTRELYVAFLTQAYHHVRHTVPLLMAVGARVPDRHAWLRDAILHRRPRPSPRSRRRPWSPTRTTR